MELTPILTIAAKGFPATAGMRNRWVLAVALVFTVSRSSSPTSAAAQASSVGFRSMVHHRQPGQSGDLPDSLIACCWGFDAIVGRRRSARSIFWPLPITRLELLLGNTRAGRGALRFSTLAGFGLVAVLLYQHMSWAGLFLYAGFMLQLGVAGPGVLSMAVLVVGAGARPYPRLGPNAIAIWFFSCWCSTCCCWAPWLRRAGQFGGEVLAWLLLLNPADVFPHPERLCARRRAHAVWPGQHRAVVPGQPSHHGRCHAGLDRSAPWAWPTGRFKCLGENTFLLPPRRHRPGLRPAPPLLGSAALAALGSLAPWWAAATLRGTTQAPGPIDTTVHQFARRHAAGRFPRPQAPRCTTPGRSAPSFSATWRELFNTPAGRRAGCGAPSACRDIQGRLGEHPVGH